MPGFQLPTPPPPPGVMLNNCYDAVLSGRGSPNMSPLHRKKKLSNLLMNKDTPILRTVLGQGQADSSQPPHHQPPSDLMEQSPRSNGSIGPEPPFYKVCLVFMFGLITIHVWYHNILKLQIYHHFKNTTLRIGIELTVPTDPYLREFCALTSGAPMLIYKLCYLYYILMWAFLLGIENSPLLQSGDSCVTFVFDSWLDVTLLIKSVILSSLAISLLFEYSMDPLGCSFLSLCQQGSPRFFILCSNNVIISSHFLQTNWPMQVQIINTHPSVEWCMKIFTFHITEIAATSKVVSFLLLDIEILLHSRDGYFISLSIIKFTNESENLLFISFLVIARTL